MEDAKLDTIEECYKRHDEIEQQLRDKGFIDDEIKTLRKVAMGIGSFPGKLLEKEVCDSLEKELDAN